MVAVTDAATGIVAIGNAAEFAPALTITLAGTVAEALSLPSAIVAPPGGAGGMGGRIDMAIRGADCHTKRMLDFRHRRVIIDFIVSDQPRQDRQTRGVGGGPPLGPAIVGVHVEERTRAAVPSSLGWVEI